MENIKQIEDLPLNSTLTADDALVELSEFTGWDDKQIKNKLRITAPELTEVVFKKNSDNELEIYFYSNNKFRTLKELNIKKEPFAKYRLIKDGEGNYQEKCDFRPGYEAEDEGNDEWLLEEE